MARGWDQSFVHPVEQAPYIERLQAIVDRVRAESLPPPAHLRRLIELFMAEYEHSAARHRVLVQDVKYLERGRRARVLARVSRISWSSTHRRRASDS